MQGDAVARWVKRHDVESRFLAALGLCDEAVRVVAERVRAEDPEAGVREFRRYVERMRNG